MTDSSPTPGSSDKKVLKKLDLSLANVNDDGSAKGEDQPKSPDKEEVRQVLSSIQMADLKPPSPPQEKPAPPKPEQAEASEAATIISSEDKKTMVDPAQQDPASDDNIPDMVADRYKVLRVIGRGGMGVVLLAKDVRLERHVAIKRLVFKSHNHKIVQRRFLREAQTIASLGHVNIVNVYDIGQDGEVAYITMEYVAGPHIDDEKPKLDPPSPINLDQYIKTKGPLKVEEAEELMLKLCNAMGYAHKQGTIHRDIKPSNILLTEDLEPKVADFGLARPIEISKTDEITLEGTMLGTPEYSAPEQWGDLKAVSVTADIYALGGVFWFILSGRIPRFYRQSDVLPRLGPILTKSMAQKPGDRFYDANDLAQAIIASRSGNSPIPSPSSSVDLPPPSDTQAIPDGMWLCTNCNNFSPETAQYCIHCGASGWQKCQLCGADMKVGAQYCPKCGEDIKLAEESVAILLAAKNHASFLEYETALEMVKELAKKNAEAKRLTKEWHEIILKRRNLLMEFDSAMRVFNIDKAVETANELKDLVPAECLSENPDFSVVVKHSELVTELRRLLVESATRAHEENNLAKFTQSIQALNQIFGEEVCGAVNSQLSNILNELEQTLTQAGLALGMNCISRATSIISQIPPWKGGDLGDRRTRIYNSCQELLEERDKSIDEIETAIRQEKYSDALSLIRKMGRFRLPPDHSEMEPAPADMEAHERIMRIDRVLTKTIDESIKTWINKDNWADIKNALLVLEQGESRSWQELLKRIKHATKQEITARHNKAVELERHGKFTSAARAWEDFLIIPQELLPPQYLNEAHDFKNRKRLNAIKRTRIIVNGGTLLFYMLFFFFASWFLWYPAYKSQAAWGYVSEIIGIVVPDFPYEFGGNVLKYQHNPMTYILLQLGLFSIVALIAQSRKLHYSPRQLERYSCPPRMIALGMLAALGPMAMALYELYYQWVYVPRNLIFLAHPIVLMTIVWALLDLARGFRKKRIPANFALTISWIVVCPILIAADRYSDPTIVPRFSLLLPENAELFRLSVWPTVAMIQSIAFLLIVLGEHLFYKHKHPEKFAEEPRRADSPLLETVTQTSVDFKK